MENTIYQLIEQLSNELHRHNHLYYIENTPEITDFEFDQLMNQLLDLESKYPEMVLDSSPTKRVGGDITKNSIPLHTTTQCSLCRIPILEKK